MAKGTVFIFFGLMVLGAAYQEVQGFLKGDSTLARAKQERGPIPATNVVHGSLDVVPAVSKLIETHKKDVDDVVFGSLNSTVGTSVSDDSSTVSSSAADAQSQRPLFKNHSRIEAEGCVVLIVEGDASSQTSQKFVVRLQSGYLILICCDTGRAQPVAGLKIGDHVAFAGEYVRGRNGDEVVKTYRDPAGGAAGWIRYGGHVYE